MSDLIRVTCNDIQRWSLSEYFDEQSIRYRSYMGKPVFPNTVLDPAARYFAHDRADIMCYLDHLLSLRTILASEGEMHGRLFRMMYRTIREYQEAHRGLW